MCVDISWESSCKSWRHSSDRRCNCYFWRSYNINTKVRCCLRAGWGPRAPPFWRSCFSIYTTYIFIVSRGRYTTKIYPSFLQLHGKTYDYKIPYTTILRIFLLPHRDNRFIFFVVRMVVFVETFWKIKWSNIQYHTVHENEYINPLSASTPWWVKLFGIRQRKKIK
jgi:hypothetical protein